MISDVFFHGADGNFERAPVAEAFHRHANVAPSSAYRYSSFMVYAPTRYHSRPLVAALLATSPFILPGLACAIRRSADGRLSSILAEFEAMTMSSTAVIRRGACRRRFHCIAVVAAVSACWSRQELMHFVARQTRLMYRLAPSIARFRQPAQFISIFCAMLMPPPPIY